MDKPLFRQAALERLSSPEQLDQLVRVTHPLGWLALLALSRSCWPQSCREFLAVCPSRTVSLCVYTITAELKPGAGVAVGD
jgi:hypothetical protein